MLVYLENREPRESFSPEELRLIGKVRYAVLGIDHQYIEERGWWAEDWVYVMDASIFKSLRLNLDFKGHRRGEIGEAWVGPQIPLTEEIFEGENLKDELLKQIASNWAYFVTHMKQCAAEEKARR